MVPVVMLVETGFRRHVAKSGVTRISHPVVRRAVLCVAVGSVEMALVNALVLNINREVNINQTVAVAPWPHLMRKSRRFMAAR
jgi:hypothetical protein